MVLTLENMKYSWRNLTMRKARSLLTILSIFMGIATIFIFVSFGWGLYDYIDGFATGATADKFSVQGRGGGAPGTSAVIFTDDDIRSVERTLGVIEAEGVYMTFAEITQRDDRRFVMVAGIDTRGNLFQELMTVDIERGRALEAGDSGRVVLGHSYSVPNRVFSRPFELNDRIIINGERFRVIGFYEPLGNPPDDTMIYMDLETFEDFFEPSGYSWIIGRAEISEMERTIERVERSLRRSRNVEEGREDFFVASFLDQIASFTAALDVVIFFIIFIAFISVIVSAVNTANTMVTSVLERIKEIGILKSIGAKNSEIFNIFLFESSLLGFAAGVIGVTVGWAFSAAAAQVLDALGWGFLQPQFSWMIFVGGIAFATIVGAVSGVIPAYEASKKRPVDALRYE
ncbi:MAG: ABC transporter permease [Candidatus Woesearchaeota archaeon]